MTKEPQKFSFDSESERNWADILKDISAKAVNSEVIDEEEIYLWGKNYISNSAIKFEYYMGAKYSSFPDLS